MSQRSTRRPREADLEKELQPSFEEYEEWRKSQVEEAPPEPEKKPEKKPFGKMDVIFIVVGVLAGLVWQACKAG